MEAEGEAAGRAALTLEAMTLTASAGQATDLANQHTAIRKHHRLLVAVGQGQLR